MDENTNNIVSINIAIATRILRNITNLIDNEDQITIEEHTKYISDIDKILKDQSLGDEVRNNLLILKQHLRRYSRFIGVIKENANLSR